MRLINATMPRSGSEFVSKLILQSLSNRPDCIISVTPGRNVNHHDCLISSSLNQEPDLFKSAEKCLVAIEHATSYLIKIESPGIDTLCLDIAERCPDILWLCSIRKIEDIIISHYNLKSWGWSEERVLQAWKNDLLVYEFLVDKGRLLAIDVDNPGHLGSGRICEFLGVDQLPEQAERAISRWEVVNPLSNQKAKAGEEVGDRIIPHTLPDLRARHPWIDLFEMRYQALLGG